MSVGLVLLAIGLLLLPRASRRSGSRHRGRGWRDPWGRGRRQRRWGRRRSEAGRVDVTRDSGAGPALTAAVVRAELPIVLDLAAVGLRAGAAVGPALTAASLAAGPVLGSALRDVSGLLSFGVDPADAWAALADVPELAPTAIIAARAGHSGARLADGFTATASRLRAEAVTNAERSAARVGVWSVLPLGLCFLPAFICVGVVPAIVGLLSQFVG